MRFDRSWVLGLGAVMALGCATFDDPPTGGSAPAGRDFTLQLSTADIRYDEVRMRDIWQARTPTTGHGRIARVLGETGWFGTVGPRVQGADYTGGITVHRFHESMLRATASFATAFLLPSALDRKIRVEGFVTPGLPGTTIRCIEEDQITAWYQLFLGLLYPWNAPRAVENELVDHLVRECMADILREIEDEDDDDTPEPGLFPPSVDGAP